MNRQLAGEMVIEILHAHAAGKKRDQRVVIGGRGNVQHGHRVARLRRHALQQRDVALDSGHQHRGTRLFETKLMQRADAVGVAVEDVVVRHGNPAYAWDPDPD